VKLEKAPFSVNNKSLVHRKSMSKRLFTALLAAVVLLALGTPCSKATYVVYDPTNFTTNMANYVSSVKSWTSDLANQLKGLQQYGTQIQQFQQQIQQYATMLNYIGNPQPSLMP
jgi:P-type conjugative transfer protein TrbJ